jgi:O-antigen/teichoic acid export membrane protein
MPVTNSQGRRKATIWHLIMLYLDNVLGIVKALLIIPLYLKYIQADLFGAWLVTGNILVWITMLNPGVGDVLVQKVSVAYARDEQGQLGGLLATYGIISLFFSGLALLLGLVLGANLHWFVSSLPVDEFNHLASAYAVNLLATVITLFSFFISGSVIGFQQTKLLGLIRNLSSVLGIITNVLLLIAGYRLLSIAYASLVSGLAAVIGYTVVLIRLLRYHQITFRYSSKEMLQSGSLLSYTLFSKLFIAVAQNMDLVLIAQFVPLEQVTSLEITRRPMKIIRGLVTTPSIAMLPTVAHLFGSPDGNKRLAQLIVQFTTYFCYGILFISAGFALLNKPLIQLWTGPQFYIGDDLNLVLSITLFLTTISYILSNFTFSMGNVRQNSLYDIAKNAVYLTLLVLLGRTNGMAGVVWAALLAALLTENWYYIYLLNKDLSIGRELLWKGLLALSNGSVAIGLVGLLIWIYPVTNWYMLIGYSFVFSALTALLANWDTQFINQLNALWLKRRPLPN